MICIASIRKTCLKKFWGMSYPKCTLNIGGSLQEETNPIFSGLLPRAVISAVTQ